MDLLRKYKSQLTFHLTLNIIIGIFVTFSSYYNLPLHYLNDYLMYCAHFTILQITIFGFCYFLSLNKFIFNIIFPILFLPSALVAFWIYTQDISISESLIQAVFETKPDIIIDVLSTQFILYFLLLIVILIIIIRWRNKLKVNQFKSPILLVAICSVCLFFYMNLSGIGNLQWRMPYNLGFGIIEYLKKDEIKILSIEKKLTCSRSDINVVFILGESVRSKNLGLNGYYRNTTPLLKKQENMISFPNIYTPLTNTAASVPQIITNKSIIKQKNKTNSYYSIYSVLNSLEYKTTWIGNQSPEKSYAPYIKENDSINLIDLQHGVFSFNKKLDQEMLPHLFLTLDQGGKKFITTHMIGSHWWYENRYSNNFKFFKPTINSKYVPSQSKEQMINSYDNTILYLDSFLNEAIEICKNKNDNTIIIYLSDHGEILGENGKWLHAQNSDASTNPAMIVWYSNTLKKSYPFLIENLKLNSEKNISTDFFYHSILDLLDVDNIEYNKSLSIFN